ncbi:hypothetical protein B566_EDAN003099 [Ephemera danica]|nr:hypothetical protein B566_EDAN003099 [Ephemera danica]
MGTCWSCFGCDEDGNTQPGEINERTHLLVDPVSNNTAIQRVHSDDFIDRYPNSLPKRTDEQSALNRILQETATNVIDVAALDSHTLEQHEYQDRVTHYMQRLNGQAMVLRWRPPPTRTCILADVPGPEKLLSTEFALHNEVALASVFFNLFSVMNSFMERAREAMEKVHVDHKEDLVVPFCIP